MPLADTFAVSGRVFMNRFMPHLIGQTHITAELEKAMRSGRLPHTMIFYGDEGLGKTTAAFDLAGEVTGLMDKVWEEDAAPRFLALGEDDDSLIYTAAEDLVWYITPPHMELSVKQFEIFMEAMVSFDDRPHVCIIDEAQTMGAFIANSLLKTLEEPKDNVYFILITHDITKMLPTIISRGDRFHFVPLTEEEFDQFIDRHAEEFSFKGGKERHDAFRLADGNPGIAIEIFDRDGREAYEKAISFWEIITSDATPFAKLSEGKLPERKEFQKELRWILFIGRNLMLLSNAPEEAEKITRVTEREKKLAPEWGEGKAEKALEVLKIALDASKRYISSKNIWDMIILQLIHIKKGDFTWREL